MLFAETVPQKRTAKRRHKECYISEGMLLISGTIKGTSLEKMLGLSQQLPHTPVSYWLLEQTLLLRKGKKGKGKRKGKGKKKIVNAMT